MYCIFLKVFETRSGGIPGVVGAIDECHIPISQPIGNAVDYYNRKGFHSIVLQGKLLLNICECLYNYKKCFLGVSNEQGIFIDVCVGSPGRMHDARVFRLSPLYENLATGNLLRPTYHLIDDSAYPLLQILMKPYQDNGHLTIEKTTFNTKLSSVRSIIERAFGLLKNKFRRLKNLEVHQPETASKVVMASCVLHNFILMQGNPQDEYEENYPVDLILEGPDNLQIDDLPVAQAEQKRQLIVNICAR